MRSTTIADTPRFLLESYGGGLSYALTEKAGGKDVHFQGDDAARFREELGGMEVARPERPTDEILGELWAQYQT